jgi:predicted dehydrogenase
MKVVIIGFGRMGQRHLQVVRGLGLDLVGVCDQNMEGLADIADKAGVSAGIRYDNAQVMLKAIRPQCVIVATTAPTHCEYTCAAAENGAKYILCEKPMAVSLEECDRMIRVCCQAGALLAVNHQMRFMEQYTEAKKVVQSEAFGALASVTVVAGNFGMAMNASHYFEMFRYITDERAEEVTAWFTETLLANPRGPQFQDRAGSVRLITASGRRFYLDAGEDQGHGFQVIYAGKFGQLVVNELFGEMRWMAREEQHRSLPTTRYGMPWVNNFRVIAPADVIAPSMAVLKALLARENYPTGEDGRAVIAILAAAHVSHENGHRSVKIDGDLPKERKFLWA